MRMRSGAAPVSAFIFGGVLAFLIATAPTPAPAATGCKGDCALLDAVALTKLCPGLTLNKAGRAATAAAAPARRAVATEVVLFMDQIAEAKDICQRSCFKTKSLDDWPCNLLEQRSVSPAD